MSLPSTAHSCYSSSLLSPSILTPKIHSSSSTTATTTTLSLKSSQESDYPTSTSSFSGDLRRPITHKPLKSSPTTSNSPKPKKLPPNPLKTLLDSDNSPINSPQPLTDKLWLTRKLSPPPPPLPKQVPSKEKETRVSKISPSDEPPTVEFRQQGKIFIGNLPLWIKKNQVAEFFRQFGPIQNVIVIKGHDDTERNMGFGFVIYGGSNAVKSAMKAVGFDGVEFHGRVLTVKLDDGRRMKAKSEERARWIEGDDSVDYRSKWHEERESSRGEFRKVLDTQPENWQAVVRAFERIKKVLIFLSSSFDFVLIACL